MKDDFNSWRGGLLEKFTSVLALTLLAGVAAPRQDLGNGLRPGMAHDRSPLRCWPFYAQAGAGCGPAEATESASQAEQRASAVLPDLTRKRWMLLAEEARENRACWYRLQSTRTSCRF